MIDSSDSKDRVIESISYDTGRLPNYVSPTIFKLNEQDRDDMITDYEPLHVAFVDIPAYGTGVAKIRGSCNGMLGVCYDQLKHAGINNNNINNIKPEIILSFVSG